MERWQKLTLAVLTILIALTGTFSAGYSTGQGDLTFISTERASGDRAGVDVIEDAYDTIRSNAVDPPSEEKLTRAAVKAMVEVLRRNEDPYALFYSPDGYRDFQELTTGHFSGIGVWLKVKQGRLEIISVLPSSPALEEGLQRGDVITSIDDKPVDGMGIDDAVNRIKGPEGSDVSLGIDRAGTSLRFTITRASIELPNVMARMTGEDLAYVRLFGFARGAGRQTRAEVKRLRRQGAEGIVLDLRDNGGGLFSEAIDVASIFIEDGRLVTFKDANEPEVVYEAEGDAFQDIPLVVLVNEGTASASEIVAGALQDRDRAILVGAKTYGKGSVQEVVPLMDSSALKLTTGTYITPDGRRINGRGIAPDVEVDADPAVQRQRAIEILEGIVLSVNDARG